MIWKTAAAMEPRRRAAGKPASICDVRRLDDTILPATQHQLML